ncbi:MAG: rhamnan synthesis protein F family [Loktanella sp.]|nr:rhamnan synthesis protein F family [Loktanella sp.]
MLIPMWKLRRELSRLGDQIRNLPRYVAELPLRRTEPARRAAYERDFDQLTKLDTGQIQLGRKPAVYLLYQPKGIAQSSFATLDWLVAHGYSPIVVSNSPLSENDQRALLARSALLLQRPNFGYDFGGYKDGIRLIIRHGITPERVIIMNDSVWLPMVPDLMERLEQREDVDILGLLEDEKIKHGTDGGQPSGKRHIESYFYMISAAGWQSDAFQNFWHDYRMTDAKSDTIRFGEIGFSRKMIEEGVAIAGLTSRALFLEKIAQQDDSFIAKTLKYAAYGDDDLRREGARIRALPIVTPGWRDQALNHIRKCVNRKRFNAAFCFANGRMFGTLFMKKNYERVFSEMRMNYLEAINDGVLPPPPDAVLAELHEVVGH